jgi:Mrp family chromosome partitioning ATPase
MRKVSLFAIKGGVGKTQTTIGLALSLQGRGFTIGMMDVDVTGPKLPAALGMTKPYPLPKIDLERNKKYPVKFNGFEIYSEGFTYDGAVMWHGSDQVSTVLGEEVKLRGSGIYSMVKNSLANVEFSPDLDYILYDLPPSCVTGDTLVYTPNGAKKIIDLRPGDTIFSVRAEILKKSEGGGRNKWHFEGGLDTNKVKTILNKGIGRVYELKTAGRKIKATNEHPFLVVKKSNGTVGIDGRIHHNYSLEWTPLNKIIVGDMVVIIKKMPENNLLNVPENLATMFGYLLGDGYIHYDSKNKEKKIPRQVVLCEPHNGKYRQKYIDLCKEVFGVTPYEEDNVISVCSTKVAHQMRTMGLDRLCLEKEIPNWLYNVPDTQKMAFIEGFIDADGHRRPDASVRRGDKCLCSANLTLITQLRSLCIYMGLRCTNITTSHNVSYLKGRKLESDSFTFEITSHKTNHSPSSLGTDKIRFNYGKGIEHKNIGFEVVTGIKELGDEAVYDLVAGNPHNFIADGIVVHNSSDSTLSLFENLPDLYGTIIVCQPTGQSVDDIIRTLDMIKSKHIPLIGMVENMAFVSCPHCGEPFYPFCDVGVDLKAFCDENHIPYLASVPLTSDKAVLKIAYDALADKVLKLGTVKIWERSFKDKLESAIIEKAAKTMFKTMKE